MGSTRTRRWLLFGAFVLVVALGVGLWALPEVIRRVAITRIHAMTGRPVHIDRIVGNVLTGRFAVHGFRLAERDGQRAFADFDRLDVSLKLLALLRGHLWIRDLVLDGSTIRVVRLPTNAFNFSDLMQSSGSPGRGSDVTVDHFVLKRGTVVLEDEALPERRTWTSEQIAIEAHNVSTRRSDGTADSGVPMKMMRTPTKPSPDASGYQTTPSPAPGRH